MQFAMASRTCSLMLSTTQLSRRPPMSDPLIHPNPTAQDVLKKVIDWASRRCPADDESVPCPLCGARADVPGDACKAVESIFPRELLRELRSVLAVESTPPSPQMLGSDPEPLHWFR